MFCLHWSNCRLTESGTEIWFIQFVLVKRESIKKIWYELIFISGWSCLKQGILKI